MIFFAAQSTAAQQPLTLEEASHQALKNNPKLQVFQWRIQALDGMRQTAKLRPGFEVAIDADNILGTGDFSGSDHAEYSLSLSSLIELGGKRRSRTAVANSQLALAQIEQQAQALDVLGNLTQRFITTLSLSEKLSVATDATRLAQTTWQSVNQRVAQGAAPEAERLRAEASLAQAKLRQAALSAELASGKMALAIQWGGEVEEIGELSGDLYGLGPAEPFDVLYQRVASSPKILQFASEARLRDAELALIRSQSSHNVHWRVGVTRFDNSGDSALSAGVSIPLFSSRRNRGSTQVAQAEREMVDYHQQAIMLTLRARLYEAWQTYQYSVTAVDQLQQDVLPLLQKALEQTQHAYDLGRYRYTDLAYAQSELLHARLAMIDAASTARLSQAVIEQLTAEPLNSAATIGLRNQLNSGNPHVSD